MKARSPRALASAEEALRGELAGAVGIGRLQRVVLVDGDPLGLAVHGGGGGEHQAAGPGGVRRRDHGRRAVHVDVVVPAGLAHRLAHLGERGHVHDGLAVVRAQRLREARTVAHVALLERRVRGHRCAVAAEQVVVHGHVVAAPQQPAHDHAADVPGSAGDHDPHLVRSFSGEPATT